MVLGLRGGPGPGAARALLTELAGAPLGWVVETVGPLEVVEAAAYVLPFDEQAEVAAWAGQLQEGPPRVLDPDPGVAPEALHERAAALLAALEAA